MIVKKTGPSGQARVKKLVFMTLIVAKTITSLSILRILVPASAIEEPTREAIVENMAA